MSGAQADAQCRQIALQQMVEMAAAQQAEAQQAAAQQAAAQQIAANRVQAEPHVVAYTSVEYVSPSNGHRHTVTPKNSYTNPTTKETCSAYDSIEYDANGKISASASGRTCVGADGKVHEA